MYYVLLYKKVRVVSPASPAAVICRRQKGGKKVDPHFWLLKLPRSILTAEAMERRVVESAAPR